MTTARQVIALRPRRSTLALLTARQLFEAPLQLFDLPTHVTGVFRHLRRHRLIQSIGNDPVNVAVMAHILQVLGQVRARTVLRGAYQILDVLLLGNRDRNRTVKFPPEAWRVTIP